MHQPWMMKLFLATAPPLLPLHTTEVRYYVKTEMCLHYILGRLPVRISSKSLDIKKLMKFHTPVKEGSNVKEMQIHYAHNGLKYCRNQFLQVYYCQITNENLLS